MQHPREQVVKEPTDIGDHPVHRVQWTGGRPPRREPIRGQKGAKALRSDRQRAIHGTEKRIK